MEPAAVEVADVSRLLEDHVREHPSGGVAWSTSGQLQSNVVRLPPGGGVDEHVEGSLDVLLVVVGGSGVVRHGGAAGALAAVHVTAPSVLLLPAGTRRSLSAGPDGLVYVTAHRARPPLLPTRR